uniref:Kinesin motor domain-containing protein n=2 Tax=Strongyloides stercoralis TaxID=6248 RepID=A0AAF5CRN1_STRER
MSNVIFKTPKLTSSSSKKDGSSKEPKRSLNECEINSVYSTYDKRKSGSSNSNIKVSLRIRPNDISLSDAGISIVGGSTLNIKHGERTLAFGFTNIFTKDTTQSEVYERTAKELVNDAIAGYNTCIFAYGQTGSGKTFSISGTLSEPGILQRFSSDLFASFSKANYFVSYYEVYNEKVYDLLNYTKEPLRVRGADVAFVENLTKVQVKCLDELEALREKASLNRATASTLMNDRSSRSHVVFMLQINQEIIDDNVENYKHSKNDGKFLRTSTSYFVDLAGSERATDVGTEHLEETKSINKSLSFLQKLIFDCADKKTYVNFRESVLTRLLKDCFGGNSKTVLLATISSEIKNRSISIGTLRFASKAALVCQQPKVVEDTNYAHIRMLEGEIKELRKIVEENNSVCKQGYHVANFKQPISPALIELNTDSSLTMWIKLENQVLTFDNQDICSIYSEESFVWTLNILKEDSVYLNGGILKKNDVVQLKHCDRIVICQQRFFIVYLDNSTSFETLPKLDDVRVEVATNEVALQYKEILEKEKQAFLENEKLIRSNIEKELDEIRQQYEEKLIDVKNEEEELRKKALEECRMLKEEISLKKQFEEELLKKFEEVQTELLKHLNNFEDVALEDARFLLERAKYEVNIVNRMLESSNKITFFKTNIIIKDVQKLDFVIRLQNKKEKIYTDLTFTEFEWLKCELTDAYTKSGSEEKFSKKFEDIFYSRNYPWKNINTNVTSGLMSMAVRNSIKLTAKKRKSSIAFTKKALSTRRQSTFTTLLESTKVSDDEEDEQLLGNPFFSYRLFLNSSLKEIAIYCVSTPYQYIMDIILKLSKSFKDLRSFMKADFNRAMGLNKLHEVVSNINSLCTSSVIFSTIDNFFSKEQFINYSLSISEIKDSIGTYIYSLDYHTLNIQCNINKIEEQLNIFQKVYGTCLTSQKVNAQELLYCIQLSDSFFEGFILGIQQFNKDIETRIKNIASCKTNDTFLKHVHEVSTYVSDKIIKDEESHNLLVLLTTIGYLFDIERTLYFDANLVTFEITCKLTELIHCLEEIFEKENNPIISELSSKIKELVFSSIGYKEFIRVMILLTTSRLLSCVLGCIGVFLNFQWVLSKPISHDLEESPFVRCTNDFFKISEGVYDAGNISLKCSPYYPFGECIRKYQNHHDTTVSFQFLKKCDDIVHEYYGKISRHKGCLQKHFGKAREYCSLNCAKEALELDDHEDSFEKTTVVGKWDLSWRSVCTNQICRLACLRQMIDKQCPKTGEVVVNALLAPFVAFKKSLEKFSDHKSFEDFLDTSSCGILFDGYIVEAKKPLIYEDNSLDVSSEFIASDFVSNVKPTPPGPLNVVGRPISNSDKKFIDEISKNKVDSVGEEEVDEEYEELDDSVGDNDNDGNIVGVDSSHVIHYDDSKEHQETDNVVYRCRFDFTRPARIFHIEPSEYRFVGHIPEYCGDTMVVDDERNMPYCSNPTLYFVTTDDNNVKEIFMNRGMREKYISKKISLEDIYGQYKDLLNRMKVDDSQISTLFGLRPEIKSNIENNNFLGVASTDKSTDSLNYDSSENEKFLSSVDEEGFLDNKSDFHNLNHMENSNNLVGFAKNTLNHDSSMPRRKVVDLDDSNEEYSLEDDLDEDEVFDVRHNDDSVLKGESNTLKQLLRNKSTRSGTILPSNAAQNSEIRSGTLTTTPVKNSTFHGQDDDSDDELNNVLPDQEEISYGTNGKLVKRNFATLHVKLPTISHIRGRRTDKHKH